LDRLIFATANNNKVKEVESILDDLKIDIKSLKDIGFQDEIEEKGLTLESNATIKAKYIYDRLKVNVFAEDTGLEVISLNLDPGVHTARYAGPEKNDDKNMDLLLKRLEGSEDRSARFRTIVSLILEGQLFLFEGVIDGAIGFEKKGENGFGYDPIFIPSGYSKSFAEMSSSEKNELSHRAKAFTKLRNFIIQ